MDLHGIRYMYEHRILPQWFFEGGQRFVEMLIRDKTVLFRIIDDIFQKEGVKNPYTTEQFAVETAKITEEIAMVKILLPEPEEEPLCYCCYLFFDQGFEKPGFFSIEKGNNIVNKNEAMEPFVCAWTAEGGHVNHGNCSLANHGDFIKCADLYMEREYGVKWRHDADE